MSIMDLTSKAREYRELQAMIKEMEAEADAIKLTLISELEARDTDTVQADVFTIKFTAYQSSKIDTAMLKRELPELAEKYTKTTEARRFSVT
jgi:predicted phage-related endonuclease